MKSQQFVVFTLGLALAISVQAADQKGADVYKKACAACHATGAAGAPKFGDQAKWAPRIATGLPALLKSAIKGKKAMPAKGGQPALSDLEVARAVVYMANAGGGKLKDPKAAEIAEAIK
jgi:cytochrome c5